MKLPRLAIAIFAIACVAASAVSLAIGAYPIRLGTIGSILGGKLLGIPGTWSASDEQVLLAIRLPRVLLAALVGSSLAASGAVMQATFRNPLASPYLLGISSGAAFGASLAMVLSSAYSPFLIQASAFGFGLLAVLLASSVARLFAQAGSTALILSGVIVGSLFSALVGAMKYMVPPDTLRTIELWSMGSFAAARWRDALYVLPPAAVACALFSVLGWRINALSLGDQQASALGVHPRAFGFLLVAVASLATSICVSVCGPIGWVGVIVPHSARMIVGANNVHVIPASVFLGGAFLVLVDLCARTVIQGEMPIGILTSVIGAAFFVVLVARNRRSSWRG